MKAISLWQPYASAVALGLKQIETRSWRPQQLGPIAICASQKKNHELREFFDSVTNAFPEVSIAFSNEMWMQFDQLPFGAVVAVARIQAAGDIDFWADSKWVGKMERAFGDYSPGRYGWVLSELVRLRRPVAVVGRQGIFDLPGPVEAKVREQLQ